MSRLFAQDSSTSWVDIFADLSQVCQYLAQYKHLFCTSPVTLTNMWFCFAVHYSVSASSRGACLRRPCLRTPNIPITKWTYSKRSAMGSAANETLYSWRYLRRPPPNIQMATPLQRHDSPATQNPASQWIAFASTSLVSPDLRTPWDTNWGSGLLDKLK